MDYEKIFKSYGNYLPVPLIHTANEIHNQHIHLFNRVLSTGKLEEGGCDEFTIDFFFKSFASMDSNNALKKIGVGEREARIATPILSRRYYGLLHGVGRSGELLSLQPKAIGSSVLHKLTHAILLDALKIIGVGRIEKCLLLPMCTGMALTQCFLNLRRHKPQAKVILFLRIDQKSCLKSIYAAGYEAVVIDNTWLENATDTAAPKKISQHHIAELGFDKQAEMHLELSLLTTGTAVSLPNSEVASTSTQAPHEPIISADYQRIPPLSTNFDELERALESIKQEEILCILSTVSCFSPREPDDIDRVGALARKYSLFHVVNNAYGLQCSYTVNELNKAAQHGYVDYVVQSTDKNFLTPIGGSIIFSSNGSLIDEVNHNYPGRASANATIDLFISLMSLGRKELITLRTNRKDIFIFIKDRLRPFCSEVGERLIDNRRNKISISITLFRFKERAKDFGSWLFKRGVSGARVITRERETNIQNILFENYGGHASGDYPGFPYIAFAITIGISKDEAEKFVEVFIATYREFSDKLNRV